MDEMVRVQPECLDCVQELVHERIRPVEALGIPFPIVLEHQREPSACDPVRYRVDASHPTAYAVLKESGFPNVTMRLGKVYRSFEMLHANDMWQIDYVELGTDKLTGRKVEFLSVINDKSRRMLSHTVEVSATTDNVLSILEEYIERYGVPATILSDYGTQWAFNNGGDTRFDEWCGSKGIRHVIGGVRKPITQGKVERWHGSIRRGANLPDKATLEEYDVLMSQYIEFYNERRSHWALGLKPHPMCIARIFSYRIHC